MHNETESKQLRSFGMIVGGIFAAIGVWPALFRGEDLRLWAVVLAGLLIGPALVWPKSLEPFYKVWMAIGHVLGWINTRIILGVVFYGLITPFGIVRRLWGRDSLHRNLEQELDTYRVKREPRPSSHFTHQF